MKKKVILSLILAIALILIAIILSSNSSKDIYDQNSLAIKPVNTNSSSTDEIEAAKNWESVLAGLSSDTSVENKSSSTKNSAASTLSNTWTSQLSRDLFGQYMQLQSVDALNQNTEQDLVQNLAENYQKDLWVTYYYSSDLKTFRNSNAEEIRNYGNKFITIEKDRASEYAKKYGPGVNAFGVADMFRGIASDLSKLDVPEDISSTHLKIVNNDYNMYLALKNIAEGEKTKKDPLKELSWIKVYGSIYTSQPKLYTEISKYFSKNGIIFDKSEDGYAWNKF